MDPNLSTFPLNDGNFYRFKNLIQERAGLKFNENQRETLQRVLFKECDQAGGLTFDQYYGLLVNQFINSPVWESLISSLTIGETYFFRDSDQVRALIQHILPDLIARHWNDRTLKIWSAGCATGEEPYTLAILLRQLIQDVDYWKITILGTDINKVALEKAAQGIYKDWSFRQSEAENALLKAYFKEDHLNYYLDPQIKKMVLFDYLNLAENVNPASNTLTENLDLILCRNVTMYLSEVVIQNLSKRFFESLLPGGWLILGASENNDQVYSQFKTLIFDKAVVYQKIGVQPAIEPHPVVNQNGTLFQKNFYLPNILRQKNSQSHLRPSLHIPKHPGEGSELRTPLKATQETGELLNYNNPSGSNEENPIKIENSLLNKGVELFKANQIDESMRLIKSVIDQNPLSSSAYSILARIYQEKGEMEQAVTQYKKVLYIDPDDILANFHLSSILEKLGRHKEAARYLHQSILLASKLQPDMLLPGSEELLVKEFLLQACS